MTVKDIFETLNDDQKQCFYYLLGIAVTIDSEKVVEEMKKALETELEGADDN